MYGETYTVESRTLRNGLTCALEITEDSERPNDVFGIWERASGHDAGTTVKDAVGDSGHWRSCNYTVAELTREYAKQRRENPSREAYESLQRELHHYLHGEMFTAHAVVKLNGCELASEAIGFDFSDYDALPGEDVTDRAKLVAREHFYWPALIRQARVNAREKASTLLAVA